MKDRIKTVLTIMIYGCIWGILEMTLGSFLHVIHLPQKGLIMGAIGCSILTVYVVKHKMIWHPIVIGCIAASFKLLNVFIYSVPIYARSIVNPGLAIICEAIAVSLIAYVIVKYVQYREKQCKIRVE